MISLVLSIQFGNKMRNSLIRGLNNFKIVCCLIILVSDIVIQLHTKSVDLKNPIVNNVRVSRKCSGKSSYGKIH